MESLHPMVVHFPIALLLAALGIEGLALIFRKQAWHTVSFWNLVLGWMGAWVAVLTGRQAMAVAKHSPEIHQMMETHERTGYVVLTLVTAVLLWRIFSRDVLSNRSRWLAWILLGTASLGMVYGASLGGKMVFEYGVGGSYGRSSGIEVIHP